LKIKHRRNDYLRMLNEIMSCYALNLIVRGCDQNYISIKANRKYVNMKKKRKSLDKF